MRGAHNETDTAPRRGHGGLSPGASNSPVSRALEDRAPVRVYPGTSTSVRVPRRGPEGAPGRTVTRIERAPARLPASGTGDRAGVNLGGTAEPERLRPCVGRGRLCCEGSRVSDDHRARRDGGRRHPAPARDGWRPALRPPHPGAGLATALATAGPLRQPRRGWQAQVLLPGLLPLSLRRRTQRGALQELRPHGRLEPLPAHAGVQRPAPHGLGRLRRAHGAVRYPHRRLPPRRHRPQQGQLQAPVRPGGDLLRLGAGDRLLRSRLLPLDAVVLPAAVPPGPGLPGHPVAVVVPHLPDHPEQPGGPGRGLLERAQRTDQEADPGLVLPHHRLRRPAAGRAAGDRVARADQADADQLDRAQRGHRDPLPTDPTRAGARAGTGNRTTCRSLPPARTPCSGSPSWSWPPSTPWWSA